MFFGNIIHSELRKDLKYLFKVKGKLIDKNKFRLPRGGLKERQKYPLLKFIRKIRLT